MVYLILLLLISISYFSELKLANKLLQAKSNIDKSIEFINKHGKAGIGTTHAWPIFRASIKNVETPILYTTIQNAPSSYKHLSKSLKHSYANKGVRYLVFEHYFTAFSDKQTQKVYTEFILTNPPDLILKNDFGSDYHTCMDAFGFTIEDDIFRDNIIVYDLQRLVKNKISKEHVSYTTKQDMLNQFNLKYNQEATKK